VKKGHGRIGGRLALLGPLCAIAALVPPASVAFAGSPLPTRAPLVRLSDLRTVSHWAYPTAEAPIHASPSAHASTVGRLRFLTVDGQAELYVALDSERASGRTWIRIEVPGRPNGRTGWVPRGALGTLNEVDGYLLIDKRSLRATLFRDGHAIFDAPVGVGKSSTVTPSGRFYVLEKLVTANTPVYGPLALGTSAYAPSLSEWPGGGVVGIHGTDEPQLIPGRPSHGCIRLRNADIERLWSLVKLGTPIDIR
jgi:hypothetical protein